MGKWDEVCNGNSVYYGKSEIKCVVGTLYVMGKEKNGDRMCQSSRISV